MSGDTLITLQAGATFNLHQGLTKGYLDAAILQALQPIREGITTMATILEDLVREVSEQRTLNGSVIALLQGLKAALDEAIVRGDMTAVKAAVDDLEAQQVELAAAMLANTPAAPA